MDTEQSPAVGGLPPPYTAQYLGCLAGSVWSEVRRPDSQQGGNVWREDQDGVREQQPQRVRVGPGHDGEVPGGLTEERRLLRRGREVLLQPGGDLDSCHCNSTQHCQVVKCGLLTDFKTTIDEHGKFTYFSSDMRPVPPGETKISSYLLTKD